MLIPIKHENMAARRWPVVTFALIAMNVLAFLITNNAMEQEAPELGKTKAHILMLAAAHPDLTRSAQAEQLVTDFRNRHPREWEQIQDPHHGLIDDWDAKMRMKDDPAELQAEMDSLSARYAQLAATSISGKYAFIPAQHKPVTYLTANFLHGGWLHLIGNMWFLWLAGFVLEDFWGRPLYAVFYLVAGAAALQFHAWTNFGSTVPTVGASGAVAALMGAFLVRFPKMKIEMMWLFAFRPYRFKAPAYALLPLWLLMEVFYGSLFGAATGVAHWAHVGGFAFGALAAVGIRYSGLEHKANRAIDDEVSWTPDTEIEQASNLMDHGQMDQAATLLAGYLASNPSSVDALNLLRQIHWRRNEAAAHQEASIKLCDLHLKAREFDTAWKDYEDFLASGGEVVPVATWLDLCRMLEEQQHFDRALSEYEKLAAAYPTERQSVMALLGAGRLCLKRLERPQEALTFFRRAAASPAPHLDFEQNIAAGIREATKAMGAAKAPSAGQ